MSTKTIQCKEDVQEALDSGTRSMIGRSYNIGIQNQPSMMRLLGALQRLWGDQEVIDRLWGYYQEQPDVLPWPR